MIEIHSSGGGTQSVCISVLVLQGKLPKPDMVVIADTGREMPTTWDYMDRWWKPALEELGVPVYRVEKEKWAAPWGKGLFATSGDLMVPAFSSINNSKLTNFCSKAWKVEVVNRWLSAEHGITRSKYRKWIGYSFDEPKRILKMMGGDEWRKGLIRFPLVHDLQLRRHESIRVVTDFGWPKPPRSSRCFDCPNQSDLEWREVQSAHPPLFQGAIKRDETMRERDPHAYLHSSIKPLKDADLSQEDDLFSASCRAESAFYEKKHRQLANHSLNHLTT